MLECTQLKTWEDELHNQQSEDEQDGEKVGWPDSRALGCAGLLEIPAKQCLVVLRNTRRIATRGGRERFGASWGCQFEGLEEKKALRSLPAVFDSITRGVCWGPSTQLGAKRWGGVPKATGDVQAS